MPAVAVAIQLKVVPDGVAVKLTKVVDEPEQMVWFKLVLVMAAAVFTEKVWVAVLEGPHSFEATKETV